MFLSFQKLFLVLSETIPRGILEINLWRNLEQHRNLKPKRSSDRKMWIAEQNFLLFRRKHSILCWTDLCIWHLACSNSVAGFGAKVTKDRELWYACIPYMFKLSDSSQYLPLAHVCGTSLMHKFYIIHGFLQGWSTKILSRLTDLRNWLFFFYYICMKLKGGIFSTIVPVAYLWSSLWSSLPFISNLIFCLSSGYSLFYLLPFSFPSPHTFLLTHDLLLTLSYASPSTLSEPWSNWSNGLLVTFLIKDFLPSPLQLHCLGFPLCELILPAPLSIVTPDDLPCFSPSLSSCWESVL